MLLLVVGLLDVIFATKFAFGKCHLADPFDALDEPFLLQLSLSFEASCAIFYSLSVGLGVIDDSAHLHCLNIFVAFISLYQTFHRTLFALIPRVPRKEGLFQGQ